MRSWISRHQFSRAHLFNSVFRGIFHHFSGFSPCWCILPPSSFVVSLFLSPPFFALFFFFFFFCLNGIFLHFSGCSLYVFFYLLLAAHFHVISSLLTLVDFPTPLFDFLFFFLFSFLFICIYIIFLFTFFTFIFDKQR